MWHCLDRPTFTFVSLKTNSSHSSELFILSFKVNQHAHAITFISVQCIFILCKYRTKNTNKISVKICDINHRKFSLKKRTAQNRTSQYDLDAHRDGRITIMFRAICNRPQSAQLPFHAVVSQCEDGSKWRKKCTSAKRSAVRFRLVSTSSTGTVRWLLDIISSLPQTHLLSTQYLVFTWAQNWFTNQCNLVHGKIMKKWCEKLKKKIKTVLSKNQCCLQSVRHT